MKNFPIVLSFLIAILCTISCVNEEGETSGLINVSFILPSSADVISGGSYTFVLDGEAPLISDVIQFESTSTGVSHLCSITEVTDTDFTIQIATTLVDGSYYVHVRRGSEKVLIGSMYIRIVTDIGFTPDESSNVYGLVSCNGVGIPDVVISDGVVLTTTDENGFYQLYSDKGLGTVFMSVPKGYEPETDGIIPKFYANLTGDTSDVEQINFNLIETDATNHILLVFGDMHLANRSAQSDRVQFRRFTENLNNFLSANSSSKIYALTLGDMTWDLYWYDNSYAIPEYIDDMNSLLQSDLMVFHTIGNHDHDMNGTGDLYKTTDYRTYLGPTYYSFNIGEYHYIVLDNIDFLDNISDRDDYVQQVSSDQLTWLVKDLETVPQDTPIILATHAPIYRDSSVDPTTRLVNATQLLSCFDGRTVHFMTGHTHRMLNVDKIGSESSGHFEHNAGAVCADWWWSYQESNILISTDGAPGGYAVFDITGQDMTWYFQPTDFDKTYQFRTYDLNQVAITYDAYVPNASDSYRSTFATYVSAYPGSSSNEVLINIWNWDSEWTLTVTENGTPLQWTQEVRYDPLHIIAYTAKRLNKNSTATFRTVQSNHFFKVTASSATSTLEITVTDRFGNTYTETMTRPKTFAIDTYL